MLPNKSEKRTKNQQNKKNEQKRETTKNKQQQHDVGTEQQCERTYNSFSSLMFSSIDQNRQTNGTTDYRELGARPKAVKAKAIEFDQNSPARQNIKQGNVAKLRMKFDGFATNDNKNEKRDTKRLERSRPKPIMPSSSAKKAKKRNAKKGGFDPKQSLILHFYRGQGGPEGDTGAN